jgi:hypothetical protein
VLADEVICTQMYQGQTPVDVSPFLWRLVPPVFRFQDGRSLPPV